MKYSVDYNDESGDVLIIPESDSCLNVAYMLYDTIVLTIPLRHVHPFGQMQHMAMAAALHKHHSNAGDDIDEALDEVDSEIENGIDSDE